MKRINEIFKPNKITVVGKSKILSTKEGKYVVKPKQKDIKSLYDYLKVRGFVNYPNLINEYDENYVYDYIEEIPQPINQKAADMANLLALLHNKTAHFKPVSIDYIKEIYEKISNNILYLEKYYHELFTSVGTQEVMSPSGYLLIRNSSKINASFAFLKSQLENWFNKVKDHTKVRIVYCHNNLTINHYLKTIDDYFVSWDHYTIDSPVLDLISLYKNDYQKYDFSNFWETYNQRFPLSQEEKQLFFIMIAMPYEINFVSNEFDNTKAINNLLIYLYKTENLIRLNYPPQNPKE